MIQSFNIQLQVAIRALREVVGPCVDPSQKHAIEQLHLSLVTLEFVKERLPYARRFFRQELEQYMSLAKEISQKAASISDAVDQKRTADTVADGHQRLSDPQAEIEDYIQVSRQLREFITDIVSTLPETPAGEEITTIIIDRSQDLIASERVWCLPFGFELSPEALPALEDILGSTTTPVAVR